MKAISVRQPWAWLIVNGYKDIENRSRETYYRGPVLIHASAHRPTQAEIHEARLILEKTHGTVVALRLPRTAEHFHLGGITGMATITGTSRNSDSPWFSGPVGWMLQDAELVTFRPLRGRLSFFETGYRKHRLFGFTVPDNYTDATEASMAGVITGAPQR
ncbi:ASCH domain-containing protein [Citrobacter sedlakii]